MKRTAFILSLCLCALTSGAWARHSSQGPVADELRKRSQTDAQRSGSNTEAEPGIRARFVADSGTGTPGNSTVGSDLRVHEGIAYEQIRIRRTGDSVEVSFSVTAGLKSVGRGGQLILTPVLFNEGRKLFLPQIGVQSRRAQLQEFRAGGPTADSGVMVQLTPGGEPLRYSAVVPYDMTLNNLLLRIERRQEACGRIHTQAAVALTDQPAFASSKAYTPHYKLPEPGQSVADSLSSLYSFVVPLTDFERSRKASGDKLFDPDMPLNMGKGLSLPQQSAVEEFIAGNEKGSIQINFSRGGTTIDRYHRENNASLVTLASVLKRIQKSDDSRVAKVVVAGFASPDGPLASNDRLAWARANAVRDFIRANSTVLSGSILLYNGSEDWRGLRELVEKSDIEAKYEILYIIDHIPVTAGREGQLMNLAGGRPYKFMERYFFPQLRNAAYIKVYYTETEDMPVVSGNLQKAVKLMDGGDFHAALDLLSKEPDPEDGMLDNLLGVCCMMTGDTAKAAEYFRNAIEAGNTDAKLNLEQLDPAPRRADGRTVR